MIVNNIWEGLVGDNLADVGDTVELASVTEFKVKSVRKCRFTNVWLYTLVNTKSKQIKGYVPEIELSKINGVTL